MAGKGKPGAKTAATKKDDVKIDDSVNFLQSYINIIFLKT